jgi:hypothetical protein
MTILSSLLGSKIALATVAVGAIALGSAGIAFAETAANSDDTVNATSTSGPTETDAPDDGSESADPTETASPTGEADDAHGPDATGSAAYGLCNAFAHGGLSSNSTAYVSLETAAIAAIVEEATPTTTDGDVQGDAPTEEATDTLALTSADYITAYCGTVAKPGNGHGNDKPAKAHSNPHKPAGTGSQKDKTTHGKSAKAHGKGAQSSDD